MSNVNDVLNGKIGPTNAKGAPAPVNNVVWSLTSDSYSIVVSPDHLSAVLTANKPGAGNKVSVKADALDGTQLSESVDLPDVVDPADLIAVKLNLSVA